MKKVIYLLSFILLLLGSTGAYASITGRIPTNTTAELVSFNFFNATTTSATSTNTTDGGGAFTIDGAKKVLIFFTRGDTTGQGNTGTSKFRIQATTNGITWYDYNNLAQIIDVYSANSYFTRVGTSTITAATSTQIYEMEQDADAFYQIRCVVQETTDGEHTCTATAEF